CAPRRSARSGDDRAWLDVAVRTYQHGPRRVRPRGGDDRLAAVERDQDEPAGKLVLRVVARLHLRLALSARAEVDAQQVRGAAGSRVVAGRHDASDHELHLVNANARTGP